MSLKDELESFADYVDKVADELSPLLRGHFAEVRGRDPEDDNLYAQLVLSGLNFDLARMPIDGVLDRTARLLRAGGHKVSNAELRAGLLGERSRMVAYMRAEARAAFEQARARILQGVQSSGDVDAEVLEQAEKVFVDYMHLRVSVAVMVWQRIIVDIAARDILKGGGWLWQYAGIRDSRNRPFCSSVLDMNRVFDDAQVEELNHHPKLQEHVPPNVRTLCGGYGCRHIFLPISRSEAGSRYRPGPLWQT